MNLMGESLLAGKVREETAAAGGLTTLMQM